EDSAGFVELVTHRVPSYSYPESAARALAAMRRYARFRDREEGELRTFSVNRGAAESSLARARAEGRALLRGDEANMLLEAYGIRTAATRFVRSVEDLPRAAAEIGYPVVMKAVGPTLIHKFEMHAVLLGVRGERARDVKAVQDALLRLAQLVSDFEAIQEIDLNPVVVFPEGDGYKTVDARIALAPPAAET